MSAGRTGNIPVFRVVRHPERSEGPHSWSRTLEHLGGPSVRAGLALSARLRMTVQCFSECRPHSYINTGLQAGVNDKGRWADRREA